MSYNSIIDARNCGCPLPLTMAKTALSKVKFGTIEMLVNGQDALYNLKRFAQNNSMSFGEEHIENYWKIKITKDCVTEISSEQQTASPQRQSIFLIISSEVFGSNRELGEILIKSFFETMRFTDNLPKTIFFLNSGVFLTTLNEDVIPILQELEMIGVEILSCGTCLKYYDLESKLKIGAVGSILQTIEAMNSNKLIWV